jgi:transcriptional regulator GlxA family with amidase domain
MARLKKASELLATTQLTVSEVAYRTGFTSPSYFAKCYKTEFGISPTDVSKPAEA